MSDYLEKLATGDLPVELDAWLLWMWDSSKPPSREICHQALLILQKRADQGEAKAVEFIREIRGYMTPETPVFIESGDEVEPPKQPIDLDSIFVYSDKTQAISDELLAERKAEGRKG